MLVDGTSRAGECNVIKPRLAAAIDAVLAIDVRLPESDPMQQKVPEKLVEINSPDETSPVLLTGNSIITHRILKLIFDAARVPVFIIPVDTNGLTADNAAATNAFTPMAVMKALTDSGISARTSTRKMIIPGVAGDAKSSIERITRWSVEIGPVSGFELPLFLIARE